MFGLIKKVWNTDMTEQAKKQKILDSLYDHCQTRTYTSKDVLAKLLQDLNVFIPPEKEEKLLSVVRDYKNTGKNLELTIDILYTALYGNNTSSTNSWDNND